MEACIEFNNAGVDCMEVGRHRIAWDFFKGALETKLALERAEKQGIPPDQALVHFRNQYIDRAEMHFCDLSSILSRTGAPDIPDANSQQEPTVSSVYHMMAQQQQNLHNAAHQNQGHAEANDATSSGESSSSSSPEQPLFYSPYIYSRPLRLTPRDDPEELSVSNSPRSRKESATIIYNLGLVDHMKNRCSDQSVALYELSMTLLTGDPVDLLGIALVNNIGVWCYENGDSDGAKTCMGHLSVFLNSCMGSVVEPNAKEGMNSNIVWLTQPPTFSASPAA